MHLLEYTGMRRGKTLALTRNIRIACWLLFEERYVLSDNGLDEEDLVTTNGLLEAGIDLAVGELLELEALNPEPEDVSYPRGESGIAGSATQIGRASCRERV